MDVHRESVLAVPREFSLSPVAKHPQRSACKDVRNWHIIFNVVDHRRGRSERCIGLPATCVAWKRGFQLKASLCVARQKTLLSKKLYKYAARAWIEVDTFCHRWNGLFAAAFHTPAASPSRSEYRRRTRMQAKACKIVERPSPYQVRLENSRTFLLTSVQSYFYSISFFFSFSLDTIRKHFLTSVKFVLDTIVLDQISFENIP